MAAPNIVLVGDLRIGKSTTIKKVLDFAPPYHGLFCRKVIDGGEIVGYELHDEHEQSLGLFAHKKLTSDKAFGPFFCDTRIFERAAEYIRHSLAESTDLFVIDEIGLMERNVFTYQAAIKDLLDAPNSVILVVQQRARWLLESLEKRPDCLLLTATRDNRNDLHHTILDALIPY